MLRRCDALYSDKVILFATDSFGYLGLLSSSVHFAWFEETRTPRGTTSSYTVSRVVRTYPFPEQMTTGLSTLGRAFSEKREVLALEGLSFTKIHNRIDDPSERSPEIESLRLDLVGLDQEVLRSYGWTDLEISHGFEDYAGGLHFCMSLAGRAEVRRRLLAENLRRAEVESQGAISGQVVAKGRLPASRGMEEMF